MTTRLFSSGRLSHPARGWLPNVILCLSLGLWGCAAQQPVAAPPSPPPLARVPVKVITPPITPARTTPPKKEAPSTLGEGLDERGLRQFTTALQKIPTKPRKRPPGEKVFPIDLNLKNADLVEAVRVLADTMGLNYSIDPRVKGTANVRASGSLTQGELLSILEAILAVNGAALVKTDNLYRIIPLDKAATGAVPVYSRGVPPPGMRAQVVFLETSGAKEMVPTLKPLMSAGGNISEAANNALILVDTPDNLEKLLQLIQLVDTQGLAKTLVRIVKVNNTDPNEIINELEVIFSAYGTLAQKGKFGVSFLPVTRLNSILTLASSGPLMERAQFWIHQLDLKADTLANVHIYHVENYKAKNLANILTQVYGGAPAAPTVREAKPEVGAPLGAAGISGGRGMQTTPRSGMGGSSMRSTSGMSGAGTGLAGATTEPGAPGALGEAGGLGAAAAPLKERAVPGAPGAPGVSPKEGVRIIPDEENNLLVVVAPPHEWNIISRILKSLDVMPRQVMAEVLIAEILLTDDLRYGVEWYLNNQPVRPADVPSNVVPTPPTSSGVAGPNPPLQILPGASAALQSLGGFTFAAIDKLNQFRVVINMLAGIGKVQVLASPHIMAANNQEARIQIGSDVPILTSTSTPLISQETSFATNTVDYRSTGIILAMRPQINAKGLITLEISQEVSNVAETTTGVAGSPTFNIRHAKTSLITADNQTVILGGLIREDTARGGRGMPGLRKMPLLGPLFGSEFSTKSRTELIVLITPRIIDTMEEGAHITHEVQDRIKLKDLRGPGNQLQPYQGSGGAVR